MTEEEVKKLEEEVEAKLEEGLTEDEAMERENQLEIDQMKDAEDKNLEKLSDNFGNGGQY